MEPHGGHGEEKPGFWVPGEAAPPRLSTKKNLIRQYRGVDIPLHDGASVNRLQQQTRLENSLGCVVSPCPCTGEKRHVHGIKVQSDGAMRSRFQLLHVQWNIFHLSYMGLSFKPPHPPPLHPTVCKYSLFQVHFVTRGLIDVSCVGKSCKCFMYPCCLRCKWPMCPAFHV